MVGGTGVVVCKEKEKFDKAQAKKLLEQSMKTDGKATGEWMYDYIKPRIIAEKFMENIDGTELRDYKILCFNGKPKFLYLASDRYSKTETLHFDWYDMELNHLPFETEGHTSKNIVLEVFPQWEEMKEVAKKLSQGFPHVRVDLYLINGHVYFGELTFFHMAGLVPFIPREWDYKLGEMIDLNTVNK